jgi:hypothetical protein
VPGRRRQARLHGSAPAANRPRTRRHEPRRCGGADDADGLRRPAPRRPSGARAALGEPSGATRRARARRASVADARSLRRPRHRGRHSDRRPRPGGHLRQAAGLAVDARPADAVLGQDQAPAPGDIGHHRLARTPRRTGRVHARAASGRRRAPTSRGRVLRTGGAQRDGLFDVLTARELPPRRRRGIRWSATLVEATVDFHGRPDGPVRDAVLREVHPLRRLSGPNERRAPVGGPSRRHALTFISSVPPGPS